MLVEYRPKKANIVVDAEGQEGKRPGDETCTSASRAICKPKFACCTTVKHFIFGIYFS